MKKKNPGNFQESGNFLCVKKKKVPFFLFFVPFLPQRNQRKHEKYHDEVGVLFEKKKKIPLRRCGKYHRFRGNKV